MSETFSPQPTSTDASPTLAGAPTPRVQASVGNQAIEERSMGDGETEESQLLNARAGALRDVATLLGDAPVNANHKRPPVHVCFMLDRLCHGGTEHWVLRLIKNLNRESVVPSLCLLDGEDELSRSLEPEGCEVIRLGVKSLRSVRDWTKARRLAEFFRRQQIDVLQTHFPDSLNYGGVVAKAAGVARVIHTNFGDDYARAPLMTRTVGRWANRLLAAKSLNAAVTNCEACRQDVLADGWPEAKPVYVVENGISLTAYEDNRWQDKDAAARAEGPYNVGIVAMLREEKCHDHLVQAAHIIRQVRDDVIFHFAGEGPMREALETQIRELGLEQHVELHGLVRDVPEFLRHVDLAVLCSRNEGLPHAILEYMASRTPTIATAVGGNVEVVQDGITGRLVPPADPQSLADAVVELVDDPERRHQMGQAAWRRVREHYSTQAMINRFERLYHQLAGGARVGGLSAKAELAADHSAP